MNVYRLITYHVRCHHFADYDCPEDALNIMTLIAQAMLEHRPLGTYGPVTAALLFRGIWPNETHLLEMKERFP